MRVLMVIRPDADTRFGGDRVQMIETAKELRNLGIDIAEKVGSTNDADYKGVDAVHLFNLQSREFSLAEARKIKASGVPLAVSTIWWEPPIEIFVETSKKWGIVARLLGRPRTLRMMEPRVDRVLKSDREDLAEIVSLADILLPNSWAEARELRRLNAHDRIHVVPNGVDTIHFDPSANYRRPTWVPGGDYIFCAARIERVKGQLGLAKAARSVNIACVLAGDEVDSAYAAKCVEYGAVVVGQKGRNELAGAYKFARLYAQPSLRETPGLAALEAAAMGCPVVITKNGCTREYFGDRAQYLDPFDNASILKAVSNTLQSAPDRSISGFVRSNFSWGRAALATAEAYSRLI